MMLLTISLRVAVLCALAFAGLQDPKGEPTRNDKAPNTPDPVAPAPEAPAEEATPEVAEPVAVRTNLDPQDVRLAPIEGQESDRAVRQAAQSAAQALLQIANDEPEALAPIRRKLQAANILLGKGLEPTCSHWLHVGWQDAAFAVTELDRAMLAEARRLVDSVESNLTDLSEADAEAANSLSRTRNHLGLYLTALEVLLIGEGDQTARQKRRAASGLSILLEEKDPAVATAAALWYAALRSEEDDKNAATSVLSVPMSSSRTKITTHDFFGRLHRCRLMANAKNPAGSIALLMQMEEACEDWFPDPEVVGQARRSLAIAQAQLLIAWRDSLPETAGETEREYLRQRIGRLLAESLGAKRPVFRLGNAIPDMLATDRDESRTEEG